MKLEYLLRVASLATLALTVFQKQYDIEWQYSAFATIMLTLWYLDLKS